MKKTVYSPQPAVRSFRLLSFVFFLSTLLTFSAFSQDWQPIGPTDVQINNYHSRIDMEILCTQTGIILWDGINAQEFIYNLPVLGACDLDDENILVIMGDGSYSDGIYKFNLSTHLFDVVEWVLYPRFIYYDNLGYYVGHESGLKKSADGIIWEDVLSFSGSDCLAMTHQSCYYVVSMIDGIVCSDDGGSTWHQSVIGSPWLSDLAFGPSNVLYGIFPDESWSSGLWSSLDFGETWWVEFWDINMTSVYHVEGLMYLGWHQTPGQGTGEGVASFNPVSGELTYMNDNLPCTLVNEITENLYIDCYNIVVCTDSGAFITCDIVVDAPEITDQPGDELFCFPNPFFSETVISLPSHTSDPFGLSIYSIDGKLIRTFENGLLLPGHFEVIWDGCDEQGRSVGKGLYYVVVWMSGETGDITVGEIIKQ
ncbi:MAG: hypothetical protein KAT48_10175 [Bacteroidales bacterium]|nr:hypothetical protein [Bacteroidales bacterium]